LWGIESGWALAAILCVCTFGTIAGMNCIFLNMTVFACNVRTSLMQALYQKVLRLSEAGVQQSSLGQIITLASADLERMFFGTLQSALLITSPSLIIACFVLLFLEIGVLPTLVGFSVVVIILPITSCIARTVGKRKRAMLELTDARVRFMTDILGGMRIVKFNAWEKSIENHIQALRVRETHENSICVRLMLISQSIGYTLPALIPFAMFVTYIYMDNELTVDRVFAILALMNVIRMPMQLIPRTVNAVTQALVSLRRIERFLTIPERGVGYESLADASLSSSGADLDVDIREASCSWGGDAERDAFKELAATAPKGKGKGKCKGKGKDSSKDDVASEASTKGKGGGKGDASKFAPVVAASPNQRPASKATLALNGVSLTVPKGQKVAIVGRVASGKSSLLCSMLGELEVKGGTISRSHPLVPYCSQVAWIQSCTVKENILFGLSENVEWYEIAVETAQLKPDLQILPHGDETSIGENGINLSGGQKARIALARAFYSALHSDAPLVLLDDPIAAVDAFVAHAVFNDGFLELLKDKTVILTLNAHLDLLWSFDRVIALEDGRVAADGGLADVMDLIPWIKDAVGSAQTPEQEDARPSRRVSINESAVVLAKTKDIGLDDSSQKVAPKLLYEPEDRVTGRVKLHNYVEWARCAIAEDGGSTFAGGFILCLIVFFFIMCQCFRVSLDVWCAQWADADHDTETGVAVYGILVSGFILSVILRVCFFTLIAMRSCRALHKAVLQKVLLAPINLFFDITPSGRILNRFSGDLEKTDDKLPEQLYNFLNLLTTASGAIIMCIGSSPFVICGIPFIGYVFFVIVSFYQKSARELKRLDAISRSPVLQHFSESIRGLVSIRAFAAAPRFVQKYDRLVGDHCKVYFSFWMASRWLAVRVDSCAACLQCLVVLVSIAWKDNINPIMMGIALVWGFQLSGLLQFAVRGFAEVENTMTGVERLVAYKFVPQEAEHVLEPRPVEAWPKGEIELRNVDVRYRPELPLVLRNVSLHIHPGERVGICGRTGSGKSTVGLILFRIVEVDSGQILFDGQDTKNIGLRDLRQRICMIPQDPVIFRRSVRENLDPFQTYQDVQIWKSLELVGMDASIRKLSGELSFLCAEGGSNFSLGQKQLLCIARALLQKPGIVMLDEATANVDAASDEIIQRTVRSHFTNITVLTIAHRLSTIADSTKIAVFDAGELIEFGTPTDLVARKGALAAMFQESGVVLHPEMCEI